MDPNKRGKIERVAPLRAFARELLEHIGDSGDNFGLAQPIDGIGHVPCHGEQTLMRRLELDDGIAYERQRPAPERQLNQARIDIGDAVAKPAIRGCQAVMRFIRMKDMAFAR